MQPVSHWCLKFQKYTIHWWSCHRLTLHLSPVKVLKSQIMYYLARVLFGMPTLTQKGEWYFCTFRMLPVELFSVPFTVLYLRGVGGTDRRPTNDTVWVCQASCQWSVSLSVLALFIKLKPRMFSLKGFGHSGKIKSTENIIWLNVS